MGGVIKSIFIKDEITRCSQGVHFKGRGPGGMDKLRQLILFNLSNWHELYSVSNIKVKKYN